MSSNKMYETLAIAKPSKEGDFETITIKRGETGERAPIPEKERKAIMFLKKCFDIILLPFSRSQVQMTLSLTSSTVVSVTQMSTSLKMSCSRSMSQNIPVFQGTSWLELSLR